MEAGNVNAARFLQELKPQETVRVEAWLRAKLGNLAVEIVASKPGATPELWIAGEFLGTVHRDDDDGEVSYSVNIVVLDDDLR